MREQEEATTTWSGSARRGEADAVAGRRGEKRVPRGKRSPARREETKGAEGAVGL